MFQFVGYNFFSDIDALNPAPSNVDNITNVKLQNAIFDHFNITKNTSTEVSTNIPTEWDYDTIMNADFDGNINAGNVDFFAQEVSSIKIKRRIQGTFDWITLDTITVNSVDDLNFVFNDLLNADNVTYDYALVPVMEDTEGDYIIDSILSNFNGVFLGDYSTIYKLMYGVSYSNNAYNQTTGVFEPLGSQYPIVISNGVLNYESGSVTATILGNDYEKTGEINPSNIVSQMGNLKQFLTNKQSKILKDWNGNIWLCVINGKVQITYKTGSSMAIPQVQFNWIQIGDANNQQDLYNNGILDSLN